MAVMERDAVRPYWDDVGLVKLLAGFFLGPAAWGLNLEINYSLVKWACASGTPEALSLLSLGALALVAIGFTLSWRCYAQLRPQADLRGGAVVDRSYFLAVAGLWLNALSALLIVTAGALHFIVSPCE
jgi:hypothetical protein